MWGLVTWTQQYDVYSNIQQKTQLAKLNKNGNNFFIFYGFHYDLQRTPE